MAKFIMYVVVSFLTFKVQIKMYKATQFAIRPSTNTMLNIHPYRMYLNSSSTGQCGVVLLFTIFNNSPNTSGELYQPFVELCIYRSLIYLCTRAASLELPLAVIQRCEVQQKLSQTSSGYHSGNFPVSLFPQCTVRSTCKFTILSISTIEVYDFRRILCFRNMCYLYSSAPFIPGGSRLSK